jgi:hypothetical protein
MVDVDMPSNIGLIHPDIDGGQVFQGTGFVSIGTFFAGDLINAQVTSLIFYLKAYPSNTVLATSTEPCTFTILPQ